MGNVHGYQDSLSGSDGGLLLPDHDNPLPLPAEDDLIGDRVAVEAVLLARFETIDVAVEVVRLPHPPAHEPIRQKYLDRIESLLLHGVSFLLPSL
jgi:hypothetical protein